MATLILGELVPLYVAVPVVVVVAVLLSVGLSRVLTEPFTERLINEREFSSNVSHQLRTPLAALRLRLEDMTLWPSITDPEIHTELDACLNEVDRLAGTVDDLLSLARDGSIGDATTIDLCKTATLAVERWRSHFEEAGRPLEMEFTTKTLRVKTPERAFFQVIDVLLENALTHGKGAVTVSIAARDKYGAVYVTDEGTLVHDDVTRLFLRSYKSASSVGLGIGLALASNVAKSAGAQLMVSSMSPTTFELRIPRK